MLSRIVNDICSQIDGLTLNEAAPALEKQLIEHAPEAVAQVIKDSQRYGSNPTPHATAAVLALSAYGYIKGIPAIARQLSEKVTDQSVPAARRAAIASVLAYLAQPGDLIPDDAPGGYGFLDDAIILRAGLVACLGSVPRSAGSIENEAKVIVFLVNLAPASVRPALQQAVTTLSHRVQVMSQLKEPMAEFILGEIVANPLKVPIPAPSQGFKAAAIPNYAQAKWSGGAVFDDNELMVPETPNRVQHLFSPA
jgi:uncharacterized membrane protein YkvA (DUF1232 family)